MIDRAEQKAYNFSYGALTSLVRFLPLSLPSRSHHVSIDKTKAAYLERVIPHMKECADQFGLLYQRNGSPVLKEAERMVRTCAAAASRLETCATRDELERGIGAILAELQDALSMLERESPIRYHPWFKNPWRYFPAKLS